MGTVADHLESAKKRKEGFTISLSWVMQCCWGRASLVLIGREPNLLSESDKRFPGLLKDRRFRE